LILLHKTIYHENGINDLSEFNRFDWYYLDV